MTPAATTGDPAREHPSLVVLTMPEHGGPPENTAPFEGLLLATVKAVLARGTVPHTPAGKLAPTARLLRLEELEEIFEAALEGCVVMGCGGEEVGDPRSAALSCVAALRERLAK